MVFQLDLTTGIRHSQLQHTEGAHIVTLEIENHLITLDGVSTQDTVNTLKTHDYLRSARIIRAFLVRAIGTWKYVQQFVEEGLEAL